MLKKHGFLYKFLQYWDVNPEHITNVADLIEALIVCIFVSVGAIPFAPFLVLEIFYKKLKNKKFSWKENKLDQP